MPFSQLETVTLGFAICALVIYILYMDKPQRIDYRLKLDLTGRKYDFAHTEKTYNSFWDILQNETSVEAFVKALQGEDNSSPQSKEGNQHAAKTNMPPNNGAVQEHVLKRIPNDNVPVSSSRLAHPGVYC